MELRVNDYVRTINGIVKIKEITNNVMRDEEDRLHYGDFIKSSPNIIDLIEVGDYVNGKKVIDTYTDYIFDYSEEFKVIRFSETDILHDVKHIKSIVTCEQFESMEYKVGD